MKKALVVLFVAVSLLVSNVIASGADQSLKIGFVDIQRVLNESEKGKKAKAALEEYVKGRQDKIDEKERSLTALKEEYDKQTTALAEDVQKKKQEDINTKVRDLKRFAIDAQEDVKKKETELTKEVFSDIRDIVNQLGKEEGYAAILESSILLYYDKTVDVSDKVIEKYNKTKK